VLVQTTRSGAFRVSAYADDSRWSANRPFGFDSFDGRVASLSFKTDGAYKSPLSTNDLVRCPAPFASPWQGLGLNNAGWYEAH
jgi:hypothetical protein